jgi:hypothetical protein
MWKYLLVLLAVAALAAWLWVRSLPDPRRVDLLGY